MARVEAKDGPSSGAPGAVSLGDRLMQMRDRLLTDPRFQRFAARFPLTRHIARRHERAAFDLCAGFVYSQTLLAAVRLGVLDRVRDGPLPAADLVARIPLPAARAALLVDAMLALGLLSRRSNARVGLGMLGGAIIANPSIAALVEHNALLYEDIADPVALLADEKVNCRIARFWPYSRESAAAVDAPAAASYSDLMARSQAMIAEEIIDAYPFAAHRRVLDVGGGEGAFLMAMARRCPALSLQLFDLPAVAERATARIQAEGLTRRIAVVGGSFLSDPLPGDQDVITLVRVVHDHDDETIDRLLSRVRQALRPRGALVIAEPMSGVAAASRVADVYFAFYLLAMGSGRPRSAEALEQLLRRAGFSRFRRVPTARPMLVSLLVAE